MKEQNRRNFLKCGAVLGATVISSGFGLSSQGSARTAHPDRSGARSRTLGSGKNAIEVSYGLGLGCMGMSWNRSFVPDRDKMIALIRKA